MRWMWPLLLGACGEPKDNPCADGFGTDDQGRCVPIEASEDGPFDTGDPLINTPPTAPGVGVLPLTPRAQGEDLECIVANPSIDLDGDPVVYTFSWVNGEGGTVDGPIVDGSVLNEGAVWTCTVVPSDGEESGPSSTAQVVIGAGPAPWLSERQSLAVSDYLFTGEMPGDGAGAPVAPAGDVDGDGRDDFLIGAYWNDESGNSAGKAYLMFGANLGATRNVSLSDADWHFVGENGGGEPPCGEEEEEEILEGELCDGDWAGHSLNTAGDIDGDGLDDILISVYRSDESGFEAGKVLLFHGSSLNPAGGRMSLGDAPIKFLGEGTEHLLGHGVSTAGDMDGDGLDDIVMGAYGADDYAGKAYVMLGSSIENELTMDIGGADYLFEGEQPQDEAGLITSPAGDIDGDGLGDIVISAMYNKQVGDGLTPTDRSGSGKVYVVTAADLPSPGVTTSLADVGRAWLAEGSGDALACGTSALGDVDDDGLDDIIMGAFGNDQGADNAGKVYVATAADMPTPQTRSAANASYGFTGEGREEWAGFSSGPAGDVDMDGRADIMVGAFRHAMPSERMVDVGKAYLFRMGLLEGPGTYSLADAHASWVGEVEGDEAGYKVGSPGDVNGDGLPDLIVSGWQLNVPSGGGKVWILLNP